MPIIETKKSTRPNTSVAFFNQSNNPAFLAAREQLGTFTVDVETSNYTKRSNEDNSMTVELTTSDDGLLQTMVVTFADLAMYNRAETAHGIELDHAYKVYVETENFEPPPPPQYVQSGIDQPFSCTTTYTFGNDILEKYPLFNFFINVVEASENLASLVNTGSALTVVHHYANSEDFTENHWDDYSYIEGLYVSGVTRTINYAIL